jgi:hypothetical protein
MNDWDKDNLHFLLTVDPEVFEDWLAQADEDDVEYAIELLQQAKSELLLQKMEILDDVEDTTDAKSILQKIRDRKLDR